MISTRMAALGALLAAACGMTGTDAIGPNASPGGDYGATPGGVKDMRLARELIAQGTVPPAAALLVEGMFSEHDLGLAGPPCAEALCLRAAGGVAPDLDGHPRGWLQIGMSSAIDPAAWQPPPTTYVMTVDVSGSMRWEQTGDLPTPGALSRALLHRLAGALRPDDRIAIVTFGNTVQVPLQPTRGDRVEGIHAAIDRLGTEGSTDMEAGLRKAYEIGRSARAEADGNLVRVVLFTDVQPNVGATEPTEFQRMVAAGADARVETTVLALGLGIGPEVLQAMAHLRGANAFSLTRKEDVALFMEEQHPLFTMPIAYDLALKVATGQRVAVDRGYGFPARPGVEPALKVSSVFLSRRRGAVLVSLNGDEDALATLGADVSLRYATPGGQVRAETLRVVRDGEPDARGHWFAQASTAKTTALALLVSAMHDAADVYDLDRDRAIALVRRAHERFSADIAGLDDASLGYEASLAREMMTLMERHAPQGTLDGY